MSLCLIRSKCENYLLCNRVYNPQEINKLHTPLEKTPFLPQEGPPLAPRRACSQTKKGMFSNVEGRKNRQGERWIEGTSPDPSEGGEPQAAMRKPMTFVVVDV